MKKILSQTNWKKLRNKSDQGINYQDNPATTEEFWKSAKIVMPQHKIHLSMRLDQDIVNYFKQFGRGYQSRINAVLRAYVNSHTKS